MLAYIARRVLLMIPTILGIMLISFVLVQFAPGGPVERIIAQLQGQDLGATSRISPARALQFILRARCRANNRVSTTLRKAIAKFRN